MTSTIRPGRGRGGMVPGKPKPWATHGKPKAKPMAKTKAAPKPLDLDDDFDTPVRQPQATDAPPPPAAPDAPKPNLRSLKDLIAAAADLLEERMAVNEELKGIVSEAKAAGYSARALRTVAQAKARSKLEDLSDYNRIVAEMIAAEL